MGVIKQQRKQRVDSIEMQRYKKSSRLYQKGGGFRRRLTEDEQIGKQLYYTRKRIIKGI